MSETLKLDRLARIEANQQEILQGQHRMEAKLDRLIVALADEDTESRPVTDLDGVSTATPRGESDSL